ncbi:MAG: lysylphosphatidylglycerol synthase domain-containing protein [Chloroflexota bacterium]
MKIWWQALSVLARLALLLLAFFPLGRMLFQNWPAVLGAFRQMDWWRFAASLFALLLVLPWMSSISWVCVRSLGTPMPVKRVFSLYFITQLPKYLPGGIWAFPGRMAAYRVAGMPDAYAVLSVLREVAALFLGAVLVGGMALLWQPALDAALQIALAAAVAACLGAIGLAHWPAFWRLLQRSPLASSRIFARLLQGDIAVLTSLRWLPGSLACSLLFWLAMGLPFAQLVAAMSLGSAGPGWLQAAALFALSWSAGFAIVLVPAGFGVRESALSLLLLPFLPAGAAASVALLSRLWWMAIEAVLIGVSIGLAGDPRAWLGQAQAGASVDAGVD